jgi:Rhs element Vgr protein
MSVSPLAGKTDLVTFTVTVNGAKMPDTCEIGEIRVHKQVNRIASAKLVFYDGDPSSEAFALSSSSTFVPGAQVTITAGYHSVESAIFKGIIVKQAIRVGKDHKSYLSVTCYDQALKMTLGRKSAYLATSDSDAISQLIGAAGLSASVESTSAVADTIVRYYATDWDFIVARAEVNGMIVLVDDGSVTVQAPKVDADPQLLIEYGDALSEINAEIDARIQLPKVQANAWDPANQAVVSANSTEPSVNAQGNWSGETLSKVLAIGQFSLQTSAPLGQSELGTWANAQLLKSRLALVRGSVSFRGNATPKPGQTIELAGLGDRFNGTAFISSVTHTIANGNWVTETGLGLSPRWFVEEAEDIEAPPASGLLPGVGGLVIGKVKQIDQDPGSSDRVLVEVPMIDPSGTGIWARLASPYATNAAGIFFYPEVGDEVVLGFLNDDPSFPIVMGSLYSGARTPPFTPDAKNTNKAIVTNAKLTISMDDDKKVIVVKTPAGQTVTLSDDAKEISLVDSNGNKLTLSNGGITLDSCKDITLTATGSVSISANGGGLTLKGATAISASAAQISASASASLSLSGDASAQLTSTGQTTVRGSLVMIN